MWQRKLKLYAWSHGACLMLGFLGLIALAAFNALLGYNGASSDIGEWILMIGSFSAPLVSLFITNYFIYKAIDIYFQKEFNVWKRLVYLLFYIGVFLFIGNTALYYFIFTLPIWPSFCIVCGFVFYGALLQAVFAATFSLFIWIVELRRAYRSS